MIESEYSSRSRRMAGLGPVPTGKESDQPYWRMRLQRRCKQEMKRVLLLDADDIRVIQAANKMCEQGLCNPVLLEDSLNQVNHLEVFSQTSKKAFWLEKIKEELFWLKVATGKTVDEWQSLTQLEQGALLLKLGYVDVAVAGAVSPTAKVIQAGLRYLGIAGHRLVSSFFLIAFEHNIYAFADCAVVPAPNLQELTQIAIDTADNYQYLTGNKASIAFLSFSTKGSAEHPHVEITRNSALELKRLRPDLNVDGELQFDAAFVPSVAAKKAKDSPVAGKANVFIFPNLEAGNIAYKIAERMGGAHAVGPVLQGFTKPWMDLSRGCRVQDIIDVTMVASSL